MVRRWRLYGDFLRPAFSASRVQHVSDLHPKFALRPHHDCAEVWQTSNLQPLRLGEEKRKEIKKKPQDENIMADHNDSNGYYYNVTIKK